ncbi:MAG: type II toxin-antitoxin system VapC family toxin [Chloroflexi bacterium]|nr:type II toxin-antitoxin system VapC family toxin [Chloroflexota bacterium]
MSAEQVATCVLDASALLASLHEEPGSEAVDAALGAGGAVISSVNWAEVVQKALARGVDTSGLRQDMEALGLRVLPFLPEDAERATSLWPLTRHLGLSLGDRACLALGQRLGIPTLTADRSWTTIAAGVQVRPIR